MNVRRQLVVASGLFLLSALFLSGFYQLSDKYDGYRMVYGLGIEKVPAAELVFYLWYAFFGSAALVSLAAGLSWTRLPGAAVAGLRRAVARPRWFVLGGALVLLAAILAFRFLVLQGAQVADDETTYRFIAQTLLRGRVVNPLPEDHAFFHNRFGVFNEAGWFGKYPVGHPALLAVGEAVGLRFLVTPAVTVLAFWLTFVAGTRLFGRKAALLATCLLLVSPQFAWTGATELSQPSIMMCTMAGMLSMLKIAETGRYRWHLAAGAAWGYAVLVRPLPGVLFLAVAVAVYLLWEPWRQWRDRPIPRIARMLVSALPVALCGLLFLWINRQQTGSPIKAGYHLVHKDLGVFVFKEAVVWGSLAGAFLRQNFWLFGWPFSFLFVLFASGKTAEKSVTEPGEGEEAGVEVEAQAVTGTAKEQQTTAGADVPAMILFWGLITADYLYRIIVPKTVVATTGPIYVAEIVPLLALATASGVLRVKQWLENAGVARAGTRVSALLMAAVVVAAVMFVPVQIQSIYRSSRSWLTPYRLLEAKNQQKALVFARFMVHPHTGLSWAYFPPTPSPTLDDPIIFAKTRSGKDALTKMVVFWQKRFPDRTAWLFKNNDGNAVLTQIKKRTERGKYYYFLDLDNAVFESMN